VAARFFRDQPSPKDVKINPNRAVEMIDMFNNIGWSHLDEDFGIRIFFMVLNSNFLTPNTYCYIRLVDALWCRDMMAIAGYNWCKINYDNTREADRKWKMDWQLGMEKLVVLGCSLFLMVRPVIPALHFDTIFYDTQNDLISICQMTDFAPQLPDASRRT
jgi:hypothetical protein